MSYTIILCAGCGLVQISALERIKYGGLCVKCAPKKEE